MSSPSYVFFLSYARTDSDEALDRFYRDLVKIVRERTGRSPKDGIGFRDTTGIEPGERWPEVLEQALSCSGVFLSLFSPAYVKSEYCGKEWAAFRTRLERHATSLHTAVQPLIIPILWIPLGARFEVLPGSVREIQYSHAELGDTYAREGLQFLIRLRKTRDYRELLTRLGQRIADAVDRHPLPPTVPPLAVAELPNAFEEESGPEPGRRRGQGDLLTLVETVCRLREPRARIERIAGAGPGGDHLRVSELYDGIARISPVAAVAHGVTAEALQSFVEEIDAIYRASDPGLISTLVYSGDPAPEDLLREARSRRVRLMSFIEYQGLIDFRGYVARQTATLAADPLYPPRLYVPQRMLPLGRGEEVEDALLRIREWLDSQHGRFILVLGDFGTGKTFLLHELARRLGEEGTGLIPILLQMRSLEKGRTLDVLLAQHFAQEEVDAFSPRPFRYMLEQGRIVLLFDGFDELALRSTYPRATEHFDALLQAATGAAKVVVTSRRQHFISDRQVTNALGERVESLAGHRIVLLQPFNREQVRRFLVGYLGDEARAEARLGLIERVHDLMGLSHNPRMLGFIADLPEEQLLAAEAGASGITAGDLYRLLLERWIVHEFERVHPRGAPPGLSVEERWKAVSALAIRLWQEPERAIGLGELEEDVAKVIEALGSDALDPATATFQVGSGTLLVRDEAGRFSFLHQSILEWLVARRAAAEIAAGGASESLALAEMSPLMADFLGQLLGDRAAQWARIALREGREVAQQNALLLLQRLGREIEHPDAVSLEGQDLRGKDLSGQNLTAARLARADLTAARLVSCRLERAILTHARLAGADLTGADLAGADLTGADLTGARLLGADLTGARLRDTVLRRAKLVGATIAPEALTGCDTFGAALPVSPSPELLTSPPSWPCEAVAWSPTGELLASTEGWAVRLFDVAAGREVRRFRGHRGVVKSVAFRPDGRALASGSFDRTIRVVDLESGRELQRLAGHRRGVVSLAFSPDGHRLASGSEDGTVRLWDGATGRETLCLDGNAGGIRSVAFSPDGRLLAAASGGKAVRVWDAATGEEVRRIPGHENGLRCVAWSPDGQLLASGGDDDTARLWEASTGSEARRFTGHAGGVRCLAFSPDGRLLATGSYDRTVRLWEAATGRQIRSAGPHDDWVKAIAFSPDGLVVASGSDDATLRLFDAATGLELRRFEGREAAGIERVAFTAASRQLAVVSSHGAPRLFDTATGRQVQRLDGPVQDVERVVIRGPRESPEGVCVVELASGREIARLNDKEAWSLSPVVVSPAGRWLAGCSADGTVHLYDLRTQRSLWRSRGHARAVTGLDFSPDGRWLASGSEDRTVRLWEVADGGEIWCAEVGRRIRAVAFAPSGTSLANGSDDGSVRLLEAATGREIQRFDGHEAAVTSLAFSADGTCLASSGNDDTVRLWEVASGACPLVLTLLPAGGWVASGPDGRYKSGEAAAGDFWHAIALCRFEPGELDQPSPDLLLPDDTPFWTAGAAPGEAERAMGMP